MDCYKVHECNPSTPKQIAQPVRSASKPLQLDSDDESDLLTSTQLQSLNCKAITSLLGELISGRVPSLKSCRPRII